MVGKIGKSFVNCMLRKNLLTHSWKPSSRRAGRPPCGQLFLGHLEVVLVALVVRLDLHCLLEAVDRLLVLVYGGVGQAHPAVGLAVLGVHVESALAVFDGGVVLLQLAVGGSTVAVKHLVGAVKVDGSAISV